MHTPGPWKWNKNYNGLEGPVGPVLSYVQYEGMWLSSENEDDNARVIEAAPDLLAALKALMEYEEHLYMPSAQGPIDAALAAIAKAEGRS